MPTKWKCLLSELYNESKKDESNNRKETEDYRYIYKGYKKRCMNLKGKEMVKLWINNAITSTTSALPETKILTRTQGHCCSREPIIEG
jgi:hypothetical protein